MIPSFLGPSLRLSDWYYPLPIWQSLYNGLWKIRNLRIWFPSMLQPRSLMIIKMGSHCKVIQCRNQVSGRQEMAYGDERRFRCSLSALSLWRFCGASGRKKGIARSPAIQDQARWSMQFVVVYGHVSLWRKSTNWRHQLPAHVRVDWSLGTGLAGTLGHCQVRS
jgi:hypothetical protein